MVATLLTIHNVWHSQCSTTSGKQWVVLSGLQCPKINTSNQKHYKKQAVVINDNIILHIGLAHDNSNTSSYGQWLKSFTPLESATSTRLQVKFSRNVNLQHHVNVIKQRTKCDDFLSSKWKKDLMVFYLMH